VTTPDFFAVVGAQRACREFSDRPVSEESVEQVLTAATRAPSAENSQPWVFVVVTDDEGRAAIGELTRRAWRGGARAYSEGRLTPGLLDEVDRGAEGGVSAAPVLVVVAGDTALGHEASMPSSIYPAVQNLLLAATALGLGSALTTLTTVLGRELGELLGLPTTVRPMAVIPIGWPARELGRSRRRPVAEKAYRERYGRPWSAARGEEGR
jgi:nitroreductase